LRKVGCSHCRFYVHFMSFYVRFCVTILTQTAPKTADEIAATMLRKKTSGNVSGSAVLCPSAGGGHKVKLARLGGTGSAEELPPRAGQIAGRQQFPAGMADSPQGVLDLRGPRRDGREVFVAQVQEGAGIVASDEVVPVDPQVVREPLPSLPGSHSSSRSPRASAESRRTSRWRRFSGEPVDPDSEGRSSGIAMPALG
jgi:hypothetical protein